MKEFELINATSVAGAVEGLRKHSGKAKILAGGTDLIGGLRGGIYLEPPEALVNLKRIPELHHISEEKGTVMIGATVTLTEIEESAIIKDKLPLLAKAASKTASRLLRNSGTIGGNVCQENRCWYYRYPDKLGGLMECVRKGGKKCFAVVGECQYHSIFGAVKKCIAVNPSDMAPVLIVLGAVVETNERSIPIGEFFSAENGEKSTVLADDELVTQFVIRIPTDTSRGCFLKFATRKTIDFPIVNCAVTLEMVADVVTKVSIALNAVHCNPYRATEGEVFLCGKTLNAETAAQTAEIAMGKARPLRSNKYKLQIAKTLIKDALLSALETK